MDRTKKNILSEVNQTQKDKCAHSHSSETPSSKSSNVSTYPEVISETGKVKTDHCWDGSNSEVIAGYKRSDWGMGKNGWGFN